MAVYAQTSLFTPLERYSVPARVAMALYSFAFYIPRTLLPLGLSPLYERPAVVRLLDPTFVGSALAVGAITVGLLLIRRRWPAGLAVWLSHVVILAPVSGLAHTGLRLTAGRYTYLSCLGWALLVGAAAAALVHARATARLGPWWGCVAAGTAAAVFVALGVSTWQQVRIWRDSETLWSHVLSIDPRSAMAHNNLASVLNTKEDLPGAIRHFQETLRLDPGQAQSHANLGATLQKQGKLDQAIEHYRRAVELKPTLAEVRGELGAIYAAQGRLEEAADRFRRALQIKPDLADVHHELGLVLARLGKVAEATEHYRRALQLAPGLARAHLDLGNALLAQRRRDEAVDAYRRALQLNPTLAEAHGSLGVTFFSQGNVDQAIAHLRRALELKPDLAEAHYNLGVVLARQGKLEEAIERHRQALKINPNFGEVSRALKRKAE